MIFIFILRESPPLSAKEDKKKSEKKYNEHQQKRFHSMYH